MLFLTVLGTRRNQIVTEAAAIATDIPEPVAGSSGIVPIGRHSYFETMTLSPLGLARFRFEDAA